MDLSNPVTPPPTDRHPRPVAPAWHTIVVLALMLGFSLVGATRKNLPGVGAHERIPGYIAAIVLEWVTVAFIWYGVSRRNVRISELVGGRWQRPTAVLRDSGIAIGFLVVALLVLNGIGRLLKATPSQALRNMLPQSAAEIAVYLLVVLTAGFCEEVIFRGYLQRQFTALTRREWGGITLQAIAFGAGHGYQGWKYMLLIAVFGAMFGLLAYWRQSLRPGMLAHAIQDAIGGLAGRHFMH